MIKVMCPRMPAKPFSIRASELLIGVPTRASMLTPPASATSTPTPTSAMKGSTFTLMMRKSSRAMPTPASVSNPAVSWRSQVRKASIGLLR